MSISDDEVEAAAEIMWNDLFGARGGAWDNPAADSVSGIQFRATARAALRAAAKVRAIRGDGEAIFPAHWQIDPETLALRVEALADGVEDRFGGIRADMSTGGSLSVKEVCDLFCELLRLNARLRGALEQKNTIGVVKNES